LPVLAAATLADSAVIFYFEMQQAMKKKNIFLTSFNFCWFNIKYSKGLA
jgi:hypothetical protein